MSDLRPLLDRFRELTRPEPSSVARLRPDLTLRDEPRLPALGRPRGHSARLVLWITAVVAALCVLAFLWTRDPLIEETVVNYNQPLLEEGANADDPLSARCVGVPVPSGVGDGSLPP